MPGNYTLRKTYVDGDVLDASDYVADHQQHIDNQTPQGTDDYSANVTQMRTVTSPGTDNAESLAMSTAGELERLRYVIKDIKSKLNGSAVTQWYTTGYTTTPQDGSVTLAKLADGATFVSLANGVASGVTVGATDTVIVSQPVTTTRTRYSVHAFIGGAIAGGVSASGLVFTLKIKVDGTTIYTAPTMSYFEAQLGNFSPIFMSGYITFFAAPGAHTFDVTLSKANAESVVSVGGSILIEEIA